VPVRRYTGGHFDHYIANYHEWEAGSVDAAAFDKPDICKDDAVVENAARGPGLDLRTELMSLLPPAFYGMLYRVFLASCLPIPRSQSAFMRVSEVSSHRFVVESGQSEVPCRYLLSQVLAVASDLVERPFALRCSNCERQSATVAPTPPRQGFPGRTLAGAQNPDCS